VGASIFLLRVRQGFPIDKKMTLLNQDRIMRNCSLTWRNWLAKTLLSGVITVLGGPALSQARQSEFVVYEVHQNLGLGGTAESAPPREYFVNLGLEHGVKVGDILEVSRRASTHDLVNQQFYRDMVYPIARVKVIHADSGASVCRLEKFLPVESTVSVSPKAIMAGDLVRSVSKR